MKTAISIPDDLYAEVESCARKLKMSRSRLFSEAARDFVARFRETPNATDAWNHAIDATGQPGDDPPARTLRQKSKRVLGREGRKRP